MVSVGRAVAPGILSIVDLRRPLLDQTMERAGDVGRVIQ